MRIPPFLGVAFTAFIFFWADVQSAVIVTTKGEEIVCEIVRETDTYLIVNHDGYQRYVLKSQIRTLRRDSESGSELRTAARKSVALFGGAQAYGPQQTPGFSGGRLVFGYPIDERFVVEGNLFYGRGRINGTGDMYSGPFRWNGATAGALWYLTEWEVIPLIDMSVGYFFLNHTVDAEEVKSLLDYYNDDRFLDYTEVLKNGIGVSLGAGAIWPFSSHWALTGRVSGIFVHTSFARQLHVLDTYGTPYLLEDNNGMLLRMLQTYVGIQATF